MSLWALSNGFMYLIEKASLSDTGHYEELTEAEEEDIALRHVIYLKSFFIGLIPTAAFIVFILHLFTN